MIEIPKKRNYGDSIPGSWYLVYKEKHTIFVCPSCGQPSCLQDEARGNNHTITPDGTVQPSVVCNWPGCTFHDFIKLLDY